MLQNDNIVLTLKYLDRLIVKHVINAPDGKKKDPKPNGWLLGYLFENKDREIYQKDIESVFHIPRSTVSNMVKQFEKQGLITRVPGEKDTRLKRICLTEKAAAIQEEINARLLATDDLLKEGIRPEDLKIFLKVAGQIISNLETYT